MNNITIKNFIPLFFNFSNLKKLHTRDLEQIDCLKLFNKFHKKKKYSINV